MSETEQRYSQIEKEALACVWALERLQMYLMGRKFKLFTHFQQFFVETSSTDTAVAVEDEPISLRKKSGDEQHRVKEVRLNIGDQVLVKQNRTNKSMSHYDPVPSVPR